MRLFIAEKPSVAKAIAAELGVTGKEGGFIESDQDKVTWCFGRMPGQAGPDAYKQPGQSRVNTQGAISMTQPSTGQAYFEVISARQGEDESLTQVVKEKLLDAMTPGYQAEFDPDEAEHAGAFAEDALSEGDALASTEDLAGSAG